MKRLENKSSLSENQNSNRVVPAFRTLHASMDYFVLEKSGRIKIEAPCNGYLNILPHIAQADLLYILDQESFKLDSKENVIREIKKGQHIYIPELHHESRYILIFIAHDAVVDMRRQINCTPIVTTDNSRINLLKKCVIDLQETNDISKNIRIQSHLLELIAFQLEWSNSSGEKPLQNNILDKIIQAQLLIESDLSRTYTISELAKAVGTNEQYLKTYFKQHIGKTIMNYALEVKMLYAKELILRDDCRISDVAQLTGYKHATHFSMTFKKFFGILPTALRTAVWLLSFQYI